MGSSQSKVGLTAGLQVVLNGADESKDSASDAAKGMFEQVNDESTNNQTVRQEEPPQIRFHSGSMEDGENTETVYHGDPQQDQQRDS